MKNRITICRMINIIGKGRKKLRAKSDKGEYTI